MKILILTPHLPEPALQGTALRNGALLRHLGARHTVDLITFLAPGEVLAPDNPLHSWCRRVAALPQPQRSTAARLRDTLLSPQPDMALRLASPAMTALVAEWLADGDYDIVQAEGIEMAAYGQQAAQAARAPGGPVATRAPDAASPAPASPAPASPAPAFIFDDHNCEYLLQKRNALTDLRHPTRWPAAAYSLVQWAKLRAYERRICRSARAVIAVSAQDAAALRALHPAIDPVVITNGIDLEQYTPNPARQHGTLPDASSATLIFTGKMDYRPNVDAVLWFAAEVLPLLQARLPGVRLQVVGRNPHARLEPLRTNPAIEITGAVDAIRPWLWNAGLCVIPLRVGGGTRFKALEAMACALPVVSTPLGVEGLGVAQGRELLLAEGAQDFADAVCLLLAPESAPLRARLGANGRRFVETTYGWAPILARLEELYAGLAPSRLPAPPAAP
jgi:glycosyltransferase involved in cell wall biosynthesis